MTFIFATTWIERAREEICYIDKVEPRGKGVRVNATCWREFVEVDHPKYDMVRNTDGAMTLGGWGNKHIKRCGPVPQDLIDAYKDGH